MCVSSPSPFSPSVSSAFFQTRVYIVWLTVCVVIDEQDGVPLADSALCGYFYMC
jgi:hypothetical protein